MIFFLLADILLTFIQHPNKNDATIQWIQKDETTFDLDDMERKERWQYYVSSYVRVEPTEGVSRTTQPLLMRNLPSGEAVSEDAMNTRKALVYSEDLTLRICVNSFKIMYKAPGSEYYIYTDNPLTWDADENVATARLRMKSREEKRRQKFTEHLVLNNKWMKGRSHDEVQRISMDFKKWIDDGIPPVTGAQANITVV